jgi:hypothetical protein
MKGLRDLIIALFLLALVFAVMLSLCYGVMTLADEIVPNDVDARCYRDKGFGVWEDTWDNDIAVKMTEQEYQQYCVDK